LVSLSPKFSGVAYGLFTATIWGGYLAMARNGIVGGMAAEDIAFLRFSVAGLIMLPWLLLNKPLALGGVGLWKSLALAALIGPVFMLLAIGGYEYAPLAHGAVFKPAVLTMVSIALAIALLDERLSRARAAGVAVIFAGLVAIAGPDLFVADGQTLRGDLMFAAAGTMWATFTVLSKLWMISPVQSTAVVSVLSGLAITPWYAVTRGFEPLLAQPVEVLISQIIVQGVLAGVIAILTFTRTVQLLGASGAAVFPAMVPAVAIVIGVPLIGEWPTGWQAIGLGLVTLGLLVALEIFNRRKRP